MSFFFFRYENNFAAWHGAARRGPRAVIVFGSDHGLCGRFNEDLLDFAAGRLEALAPEERELRVLAVGARAAALLEGAGHRPEQEFVVPGTPEAATRSVRQILLAVERWRDAGVQEVAMVHQRPRPDGRCRPVLARLLPVAPHRFRRIGQARWESRTLPTFTMDRAALLAALLRQYFFVSVLRAQIESIAAENASRLAAMQAAERSLEERGDALLAELRHRRQEAITTELLEIVSGFEALGGEASGREGARAP